MPLKRILFVDDEPHVLGGLQDLLRRHRGEWTMVFALSGEAALAELEKTPFDVVVSDMRMPGMDGTALLRRVQTQYPSVARIVLSGDADQGALVRALPVAHQFLSKPCDADTLQMVIERTCALQALLHDDAIRTMVGAFDTLPSVPKSYLDLTTAVTNPEGGLAAVASIVEQDPAMSAKVLQLVNSGFFGFNERVTSVQRSVRHLGLDLIQGLALATTVFATLNVPSRNGFCLDELQEHSVLTARLAKRLVSDPRRGEEAFAAAIVHDIGKIIMALGVPDRWEEVVRAVQATHRPFFVVEKDLLGVTHAEIGAYLLGVWGVPISIVEAVAYHHTPRLRKAGACDVLAAVHVADALINAAATASTRHPVPEEAWIDVAFLEQAGLAARIREWHDIARWELGPTADGGRRTSGPDTSRA